jgi:hypothetical protein
LNFSIFVKQLKKPLQIMKKRVVAIILTLLLVGSAGSAVAQKGVQFGVRGAIFSQNMNIKIDDALGYGDNKSSAKMGWNAGVVARMRIVGFGSGVLGAGLFLQPEVLYSQNSIKMEPIDGFEAKFKMQSIDIPVLLSAKVSIVRVQLGPVFNVMQKSPSNLADFDITVQKPTMGYAVGASLDLGILVIDGRYNGQFKDLQNSLKAGSNVYDSVKGNLSSWSLGLGLMF